MQSPRLVPVICAVSLASAAASCGASTSPSESTARRGASSTTQPTTTTTLAPVAVLERQVGAPAYSRSIEKEFTDSDGYSWRVKIDFAFGSPRKDVSNDRPGEATLQLAAAAKVQITNLTPGRTSVVELPGMIELESLSDDFSECTDPGASIRIAAPAFQERIRQGQYDKYATNYDIAPNETLSFENYASPPGYDFWGRSQQTCAEATVDSFLESWPNLPGGRFSAVLKVGGTPDPIAPGRANADSTVVFVFSQNGDFLGCGDNGDSLTVGC